MRRTLLSLVLLASLMAPASAAASDSGTVSAQVTVAAPCITVGSNLNYGTLAFSKPGELSSGSGTTSYTSCSQVPQRIYARGTDAVSVSSGTTWSLFTIDEDPCDGGPNRYRHVVTPPNSTSYALSLTDQLFEAPIPAGVTHQLGAGVLMPCSGSDGGGQTMTFSIILTATF